MAVEALPISPFGNKVSTWRPNIENDTRQLTETPLIPAEVLPYAERAANVGILSSYYLLPYSIAEEHTKFLRKAGFNPSESRKRGKNARVFLDSIQREEVDIGNLTTEEYALYLQYERKLASIKSEKVGDVGSYEDPDKRIAVATTFISNLLHYPQDRRMEILQTMGFSKQDAKQIGVKLAKAFTGTIAINIVDGPLLNVVSVVLGQLLGEDIANEVSQKHLLIKFGVITAAVASVGVYHASNYLKAKQIGRAVNHDIHTLPNVAVVATAMAHQTMKHPKEQSIKSDRELFWSSIDPRKSPQVAIDELMWWCSWFASDYGITFSVGNIAGTVSNLTQIGYMEVLIQYTKYTKYLEKKHKAGFQLTDDDFSEATYLLETLQSCRDEAVINYRLVQTKDEDTARNYALNLNEIATNPLYSLEEK